MVRTPYVDNNGVRKGAWSEDEDNKLKAYVSRFGHWNWRQLPRFAGLSRCGKSCRLRWMNYLKPGLRRGSFSLEEEELVKKLHNQLGKRWSSIAAKLPGRTDNEIKNYWHTHLKKGIKQNSNVEHTIVQNEQSHEAYQLEVSLNKDSTNENSISPPLSEIELIKENRITLFESFVQTPESFLTEPFCVDTLSSECNNSTLFESFVESPESLWSEPSSSDSLSIEGNNSTSAESFVESLDSFWTEPFLLDTLSSEYKNSTEFYEEYMYIGDGLEIFDQFMEDGYIEYLDMSAT